MPYFCITVDTEEEGLWNGRYAPEGWTARNVPEGLPRFQELCRAYGVRPTYLVDYPVATDPQAVQTLRAWQEQQLCEIGAHLHSWCTPPHIAYRFPYHSYLKNLPEPIQKAKLEVLTETIEQCFGARPRSFRAGRYGLDLTGARLLAQLGYEVDSSVVPFRSFVADGGPDFERAPLNPYWIDLQQGRDLLAPAAFPQGLLEVPITVGYTRPNFKRRHRLRRALEQSPLRHLRAVGLLDRLGIARLLKLSPEQGRAADLLSLIDACLQEGCECLTLMFHSSSLVPGLSPYVKTPDELHWFYRALEEVIRYCLHAKGLAPVTLADYATCSRGGHEAPIRTGAP
jgi:hypothetical protein